MRESTFLVTIALGHLETRTAYERASDEELAAQLPADGAAFAVLYGRYHSRIHRFVRSRVKNEAAAEDITAQVFYRVLASGATFRGESSFRSWIFQIARNRIASARARRAYDEVPLEHLPDRDTGEVSPLVVTLADEEMAEVDRIVDQLPAAQREVVRLRYWRDLSINEIADITRRSSVAVRQLLHRARPHLKRHLSRKDLSVLLGATGASALVTYSYRRRKKEHR